jgi:uncharacterized protein (TIGR02444 family)
MDLWSFAVAAYARDEVETACLDLQDGAGQCAPLLLWRLWACAQGRPVDAGLLASAIAAARAWEEMAVAPLRKMRRGLKRPFPPFGDRARTRLRQDIKAAELRAERMLLETLEAMTPAPGGAAEDAEAALTALALAWNGAARGPALLTLARAAL